MSVCVIGFYILYLPAFCVSFPAVYPDLVWKVNMGTSLYCRRETDSEHLEEWYWLLYQAMVRNSEECGCVYFVCVCVCVC